MRQCQKEEKASGIHGEVTAVGVLYCGNDNVSIVAGAKDVKNKMAGPANSVQLRHSLDSRLRISRRSDPLMNEKECQLSFILLVEELRHSFKLVHILYM